MSTLTGRPTTDAAPTARAATAKPTWEDKAACYNRPAQWWDWNAPAAMQEKARAVCLQCPVLAQCLAKADATEGSHVSGRANVKAGLTGKQRDWLFRQKRRHGTSGDAEEARLLALEAKVSGRPVEDIAAREGVEGVTLRLAVELMPKSQPELATKYLQQAMTCQEKVLASIDDVLDMRDAGVSFDAVAEYVGVDQKTVRRVVQDYLKGCVVPVTQSRAEVQAALLEQIIVHRRGGMTWSKIDEVMGQSKRWSSQYVARWRTAAAKRGEEIPAELQVAQKRFSEAEVLQIRERAAAGATDYALAMELNVRPRAIRQITSGASFQEVGGPLRPAVKDGKVAA
ncbi:WhiB family transcriptional regulator [Streptomyces nigrescens]|uniref:WhiB family transcriptional regulator n=1 Tax=Streptomyces nigrescens TaxID=1920 RepID=UPI0036BD0531